MVSGTAHRAYPTAFFFWPDTYSIAGSYEAIGLYGNLECINENRTVDILTYPQPPGIQSGSAAENDPLGWSYYTGSLCYGGDYLARNINLFPTNPTIPHSAFQTCAVHDRKSCADTIKFGGDWLVVAESSTTFEAGSGVVNKIETSEILLQPPLATQSATKSATVSIRTPTKTILLAILSYLFIVV
jgi:hypothetical protein